MPTRSNYKKKTKKGVLITFEGIEGSGKTKHINLLYSVLKKKGYPLILTREPGGTLIGENIRRLILNPDYTEMSPSTELLLYLASRAQHVHEVILPALKENQIVLCDRFHDSTYAYQGSGRGVDLKLIEPFIQVLFHHIKPDLTFLLDLSPRVAIARIKRRREKNRLDNETLAFHETVRNHYLNLAANESKRFRVIDSQREFSVVHREILDEVQRFLES